MQRTNAIFISFLIAIAIFLGASSAFALEIPGSDIIQGSSIAVDTNGGDIITVGQSFGWKILSLFKIVVSGFALIYMLMIGVYLIIYSDSEEVIKKQKRQIVYALVGFLFLNIPGLVYRVMSPDNLYGGSIDSGGGNWTDVSVFWYTASLPGFIGDLVAFSRVFAYASIVMMLTWGMFRLIISAGDEEHVKAAKYRILYSVFALISLLFIDAWIRVVVNGNIIVALPGIAGILFKLALFFVAPVGVFFIIYGAYFFITSAGDEERMKKGKTILVNTFIASLILIAAFTFLYDIMDFKF